MEAISWFFLPAGRSLYKELDGQGGMLRTLLNSLDLADDASGIEAASDVLRDSIDQAVAVKELKQALAVALDDALPRAIGSDDVTIATPTDLGQSALGAMTVAMKDGEHPARLTAQSDGFKSLALFAVLGVAQSRAKIVCVDEPENHLHVTAQRAVLRTFQSATSQTIMASHSAAMISRMHPCEIVAFGPDRCPRQLPADSEFASATAAAKYWSPSIVEALTARRVFFVEGRSDVIVVETIAELLGLHLDREGVAVVGLDGGSSFPAAYKLLGEPGFGAPTFGMLDEDMRDTWAEALGVPGSDLESRGYYVCQPDLEGMYVEALGVKRVLDLICTSPEVSERSIRQISGAARLEDLTPDGLAKYCRKYKVVVAAALSQTMTEGDARSLNFMADHLQRSLA